ncbi:hypothetical protein SCLCIDRAFT_1207760 [Scleroderma citrinum Foug A]|uniref:Uncharacterized protein n=1 Tax=Scleroderma citrinum Foug A TaxID=1036808 RepID=A0A0C3EMD1_9AGAM|nr:hypothetical protein SCLCIDRAFT_1207760 [Scleroderma citrinum Foug A]
MLRRYKTGLRAAPTSRDIHGHAVSPPPRRRYGTAVLPGSHILGSPTAPPPRVHSRVYPTTPASLPSSPNQGTHPSISLPRQSTEDSFNGPLYTLKALAVATAIVAAGASASVFGVMAYMDVNDTSGFATRMRFWVMSNLPVLSERIYRRPESKDDERVTPLFRSSSISDPSSPTTEPPPSWVSASSLSGTLGPHSTIPPFDMAAAQARLAAAYDRGGFYAWGEAALKELEAEAEAERARKSVSTRESLTGSVTKDKTK